MRAGYFTPPYVTSTFVVTGVAVMTAACVCSIFYFLLLLLCIDRSLLSFSINLVSFLFPPWIIYCKYKYTLSSYIYFFVLSLALSSFRAERIEWSRTGIEMNGIAVHFDWNGRQARAAIGDTTNKSH